MDKKKNDKIISRNINLKYIIPWLFIFFYVSTCYAYHTTGLRIQTTATLEEYLFEEVYVSGVSIDSSSGGASSLTISYKDGGISTSVFAPVCNSYIIYNVEVVNKTDQMVYLSGFDIQSMTNELGVPTTGFTVEIIETSETSMIIEPHSTAIIPIKIKNNCTSDDTTVNVIGELDYSLYEKVDVTVRSNVSDADIRVTVKYPDSNTEFHYYAQGSFTRTVPKNSLISWEVSKTGFDMVSGSRSAGTSGFNQLVTLSKKYTLSVIVTPSTINSYCVTSTNQIVLNDVGSNSVDVNYGDVITCSIGTNDDDYYYQQSGDTYSGYTETFTVSGNKTIDVTFHEKPWIMGTYTNTDYSVANNGELKNYHPGYYLIELWGGTGGKDYQQKSTVSSAGYIYATVYLPSNTSVYYSLGGNGQDGKLMEVAYGGANGGADGPAILPGAGGGYSALSINSATVDQSNINNGNVLMIAGGGGGSGAGYLPTSSPKYGPGGNGGSLSTTHKTNSIGHVYCGTDGAYAKYSSRAGKGGCTSGGAGGTSSNNADGTAGSLLQGGKAGVGTSNYDWYNGGSAGAGYYGGGGGAGRGTNGDGGGSGGGGSSLISTVKGFCTPGKVNNKGTLVGTNPSSTGGAIVISYIGKTT